MTVATIRPRGLGASDLTHPGVMVAWFIGAIVLGVPGEPLSVTALAATGVGAATSLGLVFLAMIARRRLGVPWRSEIWLVIVTVGISAGSMTAVFVLLSTTGPSLGIAGVAALPTHLVPTVIATVSLRNVLLWALFASLFSARRRYAAARRRLDGILGSHGLAAEETTALEHRHQALRTWLAMLSSRLAELRTRVTDHSAGPERERAAEELSRLAREEVPVGLAILEPSWAPPPGTPSPLPNPTVHPPRKVRLRFHGRYFSGLVGALVIGVVAMLAATTAVVEQPGFLLQIPLIVAAFAVSPASASLLLFAAALTPIVADGPSPEEFLPAVLILAVVGFSAAHRLYEVRRLRSLEVFVETLSTEALDGALANQRRIDWERRAYSAIHGGIQGTLVASGLALSRSGRDAVSRIDAVIAAVDAAIREIEAAPEPVDLARALEEVVSLWTGSVVVSVTTTRSADRVVQSNPSIAAIVLAIIGESILNAVKHENARSVSVAIETERQRLVVLARTVRHAPASEPLPGIDRESGHGLSYLAELTALLRLEPNPDGTTLLAELVIPDDAGTSQQ